MSSIKENWLFQFGFYNGKGNGNGDGGFSAITQSNGNPNLLKGAITSSTATSIDVDDSAVFDAGDHFRVGDEVILVNSITDGDTLSVKRGRLGTTKTTHSDNAQLFWNNYLAISIDDTTYNAVQYISAILSRPKIRESINLSNSTSKTSNISLSVADYEYEGSPVSQEFFGGTHKYINQEVKVFSQINSDTPTQIGTFRLTDISTDGFKLNLSLVSHRPWDFISIPQTRTTGTNRFFPVAYGSYDSTTTSTISSTDLCTNKDLFPVPIDKFGSGSCITLHPHPNTVTDAKVFYYEKNMDKFIPIYTTSYFMDTIAYEGGFASKVPSTLTRAIKFRPDAFDVDNEFTDADNAFDGSTSTFSTDTSGEAQIALGHPSLSDTFTDDRDLILSIPQLDGRCNTFKQKVYGNVTLTKSGGNINTSLSTVKLKDQTYSRNAAVFTQTNVGSTTLQYSSVIDSYTENNNLPEKIRFQIVTNVVSNDSTIATVEGSGKVYDVECQVEMQVDPNADKKNFNVQNLYSGADGLSRSWSSGVCDEIQEAHLDLLMRFAGLTQKDGTAITDPTSDSQVDGWGALDSARTDWDIRYWTLKEVPLKKVLDRMAFEGCFIYRYKRDGTPEYIHIPNSPSTEHTLSKDDISNIQVSITPFSEIITKRNISYKKHPAENRYLETETTIDSTNNPRQKWGLKDKENIEEVNLDMLVNKIGDTDSDGNIGDENPNNSFAAYYNNIFGDVKVMVSCSISNSNYLSIEVGDIIEFDENNMHPLTPMGHNSATWNNLQMMVISTDRGVGTMSITAREI